MELLKSVTGKVVAGAVMLAVIAAGISWWQMDPQTRQGLVSGTGKVLAWFGVVLALPWATFFLTTWIARLQSNLAGGLLVAGYTLVELVILLWLFDWTITGPTAWTFAGAAVLVAAVYNLLVCDWLAEKLG